MCSLPFTLLAQVPLGLLLRIIPFSSLCDWCLMRVQTVFSFRCSFSSYFNRLLLFLLYILCIWRAPRPIYKTFLYVKHRRYWTLRRTDEGNCSCWSQYPCPRYFTCKSTSPMNLEVILFHTSFFIRITLIRTRNFLNEDFSFFFKKTLGTSEQKHVLCFHVITLKIKTVPKTQTTAVCSLFTVILWTHLH